MKNSREMVIWTQSVKTKVIIFLDFYLIAMSTIYS